MNWISRKEFKLVNSGNRKYVYRRLSNGSKQTINVPNSVTFNIGSVQKWLRTNYTSPKSRIPIFTPGSKSTKGMGWAPVNSKTPNFNCKIGNHLYHRAANNGTVGFHRLNVNNTSNSINLVPLKKTVIRKGIAKVDAGKQGVVFLASTKASVPQGSEFVIKVCPTDKNVPRSKQISEIEYKIQSALYKVVPGNIPKPIAPLITCKDFLSPSELMSKSATVNTNKDYSHQTLMFSEYIPFGPMPYYLEKIALSKRRRLSDSLMKSLIFQILRALYKIRRTYPGFRHNDLHMDNILIKPGSPYPVAVLNDFGFSTLDNKKVGNPLVNNGDFQNSWGIGPSTTQDYDVHLILNEIRKWCERNKAAAVDQFRTTLMFLNDKVPEGYRNAEDRYTTHTRLKYNIKYPGLPSLRQILKSKFFDNKMNLTPTPTPIAKLKLNLNKKAFTNANLNQAGVSPEMRAWALGKRVRANTPAPSRRLSVINLSKSPSPKKNKIEIINLSNSPSPKKKSPSPKKKSPSPNKKSPSPNKKSPSPNKKSPVSNSNNNSSPGKFPLEMTLATRRRLNRIAGRYEKKYTQREVENARNKAWQRALRLVTKRVREGRMAFTPSPTRKPIPVSLPHSTKKTQAQKELEKRRKMLQKKK